MILRLRAADFGKFKGRTFELGPVTVVHGPNEAGKTTFFDALFHALCRPSETKKVGKLLKQRYGAGRKAEVDMAGPFEMDEDEFLNLAAIRAGDLDMEMGKGSAWLDRLKSRLFHGGLDPAALAAEFARRSSDNRTYAHNKELEALRLKAGTAREELDKRLRERETYLAREKALAAGEARLEETRRLRESNQEERKAVQAKVAFEDKIERRRKLASALSRLEDRETLSAQLRELEPYKEDKRAEWDSLAAATKAAAEKAQADQVRKDSLADQTAKARSALGRLEEQKARQGARSALAATVASDFRNALAHAEGPKGAATAWLAALSSLATGAAGSFALSSPSGKAAVFGLGALVSVLLFFLLRRLGSGRQAESRKQALAKAKDRFAVGEMDLAARHALPGPETPVSLAGITTGEGLLQALDRLALEGETWERQIAAARRDLLALEEDGVRAEQGVKDSRAMEEKARLAEREWLAAKGVSRVEDYLIKVSRYQSAQKEWARLNRDSGPGQVMDPLEERREISRQLKDLDEEGVPRQGLDEAALQRLRRQAQDLEAARERLERDFNELTASKERQAGEIRGALGKLAGEIVRAEEDLLQREGQVAEKELDRRAAAIAHEIFKEIGEGADLLLRGLAMELEAMLEHILPGGRAVALLGLDQKQFQVDDAAGGRRALDNLSSGTQDAVVLAAKLALALKTRNEGKGLLVLDDPFLAMDRQREERALRMLQDFHLRHGWQIILLTKDAHLRDGMVRLFPDCRAIDLLQI